MQVNATRLENGEFPFDRRGKRALLKSDATVQWLVFGTRELVLANEGKRLLLSNSNALTPNENKVVFAGRNTYDPIKVEAAAIAYYGIGRGRSVTKNVQDHS